MNIVDKDSIKRPSFLADLMSFDIIDAFKDLLDGGGWGIDPVSKKIRPNQQMIDHNRKWIYVNPDPNRDCSMLQMIFGRLGFVPTRCRGCWKVVVKMKTVKQLFAMLDFQQEFTKKCQGSGRFCKCGIEKRHWVHYQYGAYFYCDSKEQGQRRYKEVRAAVNRIDPSIEVTLKRGCTEMEIKCGPTDKYEQPFESNKVNPSQPLYLVRHIMKEWLLFAWDRGDPTAIEFNNGEPFYSQCVTYHEEGS